MNEKKINYLWQYVTYWASVYPDLPAIHFKDRHFTWKEFDIKTDTLAKSFLHIGLKKGDIVATLLPASPEYLFTLIAADKIGAVICALDIKYKSADLKKFLSHLHPAVLISLRHQDSSDTETILHDIMNEFDIAPQVQYVTVGERGTGLSFEDLLVSGPTEDENLTHAKTDQNKNDDLLIVFTGGTTGTPKAAMLSKINVAGMAAAEVSIINRHLGYEDGPKRIKSIVSLTPSHVGGTVELMGMGITGGMEMFVNDTWSPVHIFETVEKENIEWIGGVPTMYAIMLITPQLKDYNLSSLKLAVLSGEKTETELLEQIQTRICPNLIIGYGSTEAGAEVTFTEPGDDIQKIVQGFVGHPLSGYSIRIVDREDHDLPEYEEGEVLVRSDFTIKKYFKMPDEDRQGFTHDGYCRTGDLGYLTKEGELFIKGRTKHIIRVGSYTVMPAEIEEVVTQDSSVGIAAAIGVPDKILGEVVWLIVSPASGSAIDPDHLINLCETQLAKFKVPKRIIIKDDLPVTHIGKINRALLQTEIIKKIKEGLL